MNEVNVISNKSNKSKSKSKSKSVGGTKDNKRDQEVMTRCDRLDFVMESIGPQFVLQYPQASWQNVC